MKKYLCIFLVACILQIIALNVSAQDIGSSTAADGSGNVYVTGYFTSSTITFGGIILTNHSTPPTGYNDMYIVKYGPIGNVLWAKSAGGPGNDGGGSIATDGSGNVYVTGGFSTTITFGNIILKNGGVFIVKYDANGNALWAKSASGGSGSGIAVDVSGNVFVTGYFSSSITFGKTTLNSAGSTDMFVVKYAANGNVLWSKGAGGSDKDYGEGVATDGSGNVYVTGMFFSPTITFGTIALTNTGYYDMYIVKYNASGNVLWAKSASGNRVDEGLSIAIDLSGNAFVTGWFDSPTITFGTITLTNSTSPNYDMFIVKYDATGNVLWAKGAGGSLNDKGSGVATDGSGNVFVTGMFQSSSITFDTITLNNSGLTDIFVVKYNADGGVLWAKRAVGTNNDIGVGIATDGSENVNVTGYFISSSITFGTITLSNTNGNSSDYDMFIAKYDANGNVPWANCAGGTPADAPKSANKGNNDPVSIEVTIYPNPTSGKVFLSTANSQSAITSIYVFNMTGKEVFSRQSAVGSPQMDIDLSSQPKGVYILLIKSGDNFYRRKIIVE